MKRIVQFVLIVLFAAACGQQKKNEVDNGQSDFMLHKVMVGQVVQTTNYTYLLVNEGEKEYWTAVTKGEYITGDQLFYFDAAVTKMENFHSKELNRDFETILFITKVSRDSNGEGINQMRPASSETGHTGRKETPENNSISVSKADGGITIAGIYEHKAELVNTKVKIKGVVVIVNNQIMGRNWVHIQDGTKYHNDYDLTVTTQETVNVNDEVTFEGVLAVDKDFTSGYFYPVIIEAATLVR